jgi:hypothetical protein
LASKRTDRVRFTKHAYEKFEFLRRYGFEVDEAAIVEAVENPSRVERRGDQFLALKPLDEEYAIRVVYRAINDNIVVVTFYPVKRARFNV